MIYRVLFFILIAQLSPAQVSDSLLQDFLLDDELKIENSIEIIQTMISLPFGQKQKMILYTES